MDDPLFSDCPSEYEIHNPEFLIIRGDVFKDGKYYGHVIDCGKKWMTVLINNGNMYMTGTTTTIQFSSKSKNGILQDVFIAPYEINMEDIWDRLDVTKLKK